MKEFYTINDIAMITGLSSRTIRNYIKMEILKGEKVDGVWHFTNEEMDAFMADPAVRPSILAKKNAHVYDFMLDRHKKENEICMILDLCGDNEIATEISDFFCHEISETKWGGPIQFSMDRFDEHIRVILKGTEDCVLELIKRYYQL